MKMVSIHMIVFAAAAGAAAEAAVDQLASAMPSQSEDAREMKATRKTEVARKLKADAKEKADTHAKEKADAHAKEKADAQVICYLDGGDFSCAVPGVKDVCCTMAKEVVEEGKMRPDLPKTCPMIAGLMVDENQKKMFCSPKQTCNFTGSMGLLKYDCSVQNTEKPCCDLTIAMSACGEDEECKTKVFLEAEGFDIEKMQDPAYAKSRCPVLAEFDGKEKKAAMHRNCKIDMGNTLDSSLLRKSDCSIATDEFSCTVPDVKDICCKVAKAVLPCGVDAPESAKCRADLLSGEMLPQLQAAGVGSYTEGVCPGIESMNNKKKQEYCTPSKAAATSSLFLLFNDALTSAPEETNMAFGVLCVVAVVASLAVVMRRRWQATSVETHEPLSRRIACHANEVELQAECGLVE